MKKLKKFAKNLFNAKRTKLLAMIIVIGLRPTERSHNQFTARLDIGQIELLSDSDGVEYRAIGRNHSLPFRRAGGKHKKHP